MLYRTLSQFTTDVKGVAARLQRHRHGRVTDIDLAEIWIRHKRMPREGSPGRPLSDREIRALAEVLSQAARNHITHLDAFNRKVEAINRGVFGS